ncbi:MAG: transposase, partial [Bacteroidetes bacterium]|nr:transposase [Bacteroidota bacterium]
MKQIRRNLSGEFKAQVAIAALKERESLAELAKWFDVQPLLIARWKKEFIARSVEIFETKAPEQAYQVEKDRLFSKIGQLEMENDFFKKSLKKTRPVKGDKTLVLDKTTLSVRKQCKLLDINRSSVYYKPHGESKENLELMRKMDEHYMKHPTEGVLRVQDHLLTLSLVVNVKRIRR